ncbi:MAG TPA: hypothetical protein PKC25_17520, partial [Candidatus Rifleibacterium sp.]|nr:hypothetical protein [Candidatus Rifleibacterium sp.]
LGQLTERIQASMTEDQLGDGLHFDGSKALFMTYGESNGQIQVTSGRNGELGRINFTGEESLVKALGFQTVIPAEDPVYSIAVTNLGVPFGERQTLTTQIAGHRAMGLIEGIDLMFEPPMAAYAQTTSAQLGISLPTAVTFDVNDSVSANGTAAVNITIASGNWSMSQVVSIMNEQLAAVSSMVTARLNDSYAIELTTKNTGSAAGYRQWPLQWHWWQPRSGNWLRYHRFLRFLTGRHHNAVLDYRQSLKHCQWDHHQPHR